MIALEIGPTVKWATESSMGEAYFPVCQSSRTTRYQAFTNWLYEISPDSICYLEKKGDDIYNKFLQYLMAWCAENEVKHKGFNGDLVRKFTRSEPSPESLLKFAKAHKW